MKIILLLSAIIIIYADINFNKDYQYFDPRTYGGDIHSNPCEEMKQTSKYRKYVNDHIKCIGKWCIDGLFKCPSGGYNIDCYVVEHIIDRQFKGKNITGNYIMAWGKWNNNISHLTEEATYTEKLSKYGKRIMDLAENFNNICW
jgi:hypothetical protein